jgi:formylmethanofuran dehydrogenase subunit A
VLKEAKTTNSVYLYSFDEESKTITTIRVSDHSNHSLFYSWSDNEWESFALENFNVEDVNVEEEDDIIIDFNCTFDEWLSLEDGKTFELLN